jgi:hypothetical protein
VHDPEKWKSVFGKDHAQAIGEYGIMNHKVLFAIAIAGLFSFYPPATQAQPMRCSGEQQVCISNCNKNPNRAFASNCIANCRARQSVCKQTGCWDSGTNKYCGLTRQ